jgi:hypothetical protein
MKKYFGILTAGVLAACSSSSNNGGGTTPPPLGNFTYSNPQPANTTQAATANNAQQQVPDVVTGAATGSPQAAQSAPELAESVAFEALDSRALPPNPAYQVIKKLAKASKSGDIDDPTCITTTATTITYNNCVLSSTGFSATYNGSLTVGSNSVSWDLSYTGSDTESNETFNEQGSWKGNITVNGTATDGSVSGEATSTFTGNIVTSSATESYAYTAGVDFLNLVYTTACSNAGGFFVSGILEVRLNVAETGTYTAPFTNAAAEFTWTACDTVEYAAGTD